MRIKIGWNITTLHQTLAHATPHTILT